MSLSIEEHIAQAKHFIQRGVLHKALAHLDYILTHHPTHKVALRLRGYVLISLKRWKEAFALYQQLLSFNHHDVDALVKCGHIFMHTKKHQQALVYFNAAFKLDPTNAITSSLRGNALMALKRPRQAAQCFSFALQHDPHNIMTLVNYGCVLYELAQYQQALDCFEKILTINPNHLLGLSYRAFCLVSFNRHDEAMTYYAKALAIDPTHAITHFNESLCRLVMGDFKIGWQKHEWRWKTEMAHVNRHFAQPLWLGDADLTGKSILLYYEQGFGDTIHFMRYVPMVAALGARVILEVQPELLSLIRNIKGVDQLIAHGDTLPITDYQCPLMSLPLAFGTELSTIPVSIPYVFSDATLVTQWQNKLAHLTKPKKVGIVWSGNPLNKTNIRRSIPLEVLLRAQVASVDFISLQKRITPQELTLLNTHDIPVFADELTDFNQTAALIECLDLVITTDTAVAHIAAAMGKPTWVLLAFSPDWRWLLNRHDSPWYPTMTLFRQHAMWDWSNVIEAVKEKLGGL